MEVRKIFRKLVTNQFTCSEDFGYFGQRFAFRTVFSKTTYSYCCCSCAFEHEYLGYLSDDGHINDAVYDKIAKSIVDGQCPHVGKVSREHLRETIIYGIHIASSVAAEKTVKYHSKNTLIFKTGIFKLSPHTLAVMKNKSQNEGIYYLHFPKLHGLLWISEPILYASRRNAHVKVEELDCLEMSVQKKNVKLLNSILHTSVVHMGLPKAFEFTIKHNLFDLQDVLLHYTCKNKVTHKFYFAEAAIVYDQPKTLDKILSFNPCVPFEPSSECKLSELCAVLMRNQCEMVLKKHALLQRVDITSDEKFLELLYRLSEFYGELRIEIKTFLIIYLKLYPRDVSQFLKKCLTIQPVNLNAVNILLSLGAGTNYQGVCDKPPVIGMLSSLGHYSPGVYLNCARKTLELLIYENPDLELHTTAVYLGIQEDARLQVLKRKKEVELVGTYKPDTKEHGLFGHDGYANFALNFLGPFLIACGFPVRRGELLASLEKPLHPTEHAFIKDFLDCPRSLMVHCRIELRRHYSGRRIHSFLDVSDCPQKLKEFILLESVCLA